MHIVRDNVAPCDAYRSVASDSILPAGSVGVKESKRQSFPCHVDAATIRLSLNPNRLFVLSLLLFVYPQLMDQTVIWMGFSARNLETALRKEQTKSHDEN